VKTIDGLLTVGKGQRVGIFAGSGVGKSTLIGMIARNTKADVNVIALIGERGREVREFIEKDLKEEGLKRSVVVVATSDQPALIRLKGALMATAIAEYSEIREKTYFCLWILLRGLPWPEGNWAVNWRTTGFKRLHPFSVFDNAKAAGTGRKFSIRVDYRTVYGVG